MQHLSSVWLRRMHLFDDMTTLLGDYKSNNTFQVQSTLFLSRDENKVSSRNITS